MCGPGTGWPERSLSGDSDGPRSSEQMRVHRLLSLKYGLDDLERWGPEGAQFADLNDPFELLSVEHSDRVLRRRFAIWRKRAMARYRPLLQQGLREPGSGMPLAAWLARSTASPTVGSAGTH